MVRLVSRCALLAIFPLVSACSGDNLSGASIAGEAMPMQLNDQQFQYTPNLLQRASELSPNPQILVAICENEARQFGYKGNALSNFMYLCIEDSGMD